jgi:hypothetical protein
MARSAGIFLSAILLGTLLGGCRLIVTLTLTPDAVTLAVLEQAALTATWSGSGELAWDTTGGEIAASGSDATYTAPANAGSYSVTVRSADDPTTSAAVTVTVVPTLTLTPDDVTVEVGANLALTADLDGASGLQWQASGGSVSGDGDGAVWTAPGSVGSYSVTATSVTHPSVSASADVTVVATGSGPDLAPPTPAALALAAAIGDGATGSFTLRNEGDATLTFNLAAGEGWLSVTPDSGDLAPGADTVIAVDALCTTLGDSSSDVSVTSNDGSAGSGTVAVDLACSARLGAPTPASVALAAEVDQSDSGSFSFDNLAASATDFTVVGAPAWLIVDPAGGSVAAGTPRSVTLSTTCGADASSDLATLTLGSDTPGDGETSVTVTRNCTEPPPPPPTSAFEITLVFSGSITDPQKAVFESAAARWAELIVGDVPDSSLTKSANACGAGDPAFDGAIDDVVIYATVEPIDGAGSILGSAGPCYIRSGSGLTRYGIMRFDSADVGGLGDAFEDVILHEMGHVLGIGTLWSYLNLLSYSGGSCQASSDPTFTGSGAVGEWSALTGSGDVPVEDSGGSGTKCGHWEETVFNNELMTGYLDGGSNPISRMTVASLDDLGYGVDLGAADPYALPSCSGSCLRLGNGIDLLGAEKILEPRYALDDDGGVTALD